MVPVFRFELGPVSNRFYDMLEDIEFLAALFLRLTSFLSWEVRRMTLTARSRCPTLYTAHRRFQSHRGHDALWCLPGPFRLLRSES